MVVWWRMSTSSELRRERKSEREKRERLYDGVQPLSKSGERGKYRRPPKKDYRFKLSDDDEDDVSCS